MTFHFDSSLRNDFDKLVGLDCKKLPKCQCHSLSLTLLQSSCEGQNLNYERIFFTLLRSPTVRSVADKMNPVGKSYISPNSQNFTVGVRISST